MVRQHAPATVGEDVDIGRQDHRTTATGTAADLFLDRVHGQSRVAAGLDQPVLDLRRTGLVEDLPPAVEDDLDAAQQDVAGMDAAGGG